LDGRAQSQLESATAQAKDLYTGVAQSVSGAIREIRRDPRMESADARKAALKLLAYIAGALLILNAIVNAPRRR
jgi:hypothetical protein